MIASPLLSSRRLVSMLAAGLGLLSLLPAGADANSFTTIYTFTPDTDGNLPYPTLVEGADGKLYGTNSAGGKNSNGTVFSIDPKGSHFDLLSSFPDTSGGTTPEAGLVQARDGNFYGATYAGGSNGFGVFYQVTPAGTLTYLDAFNNGDPGANPIGTPFEGIDGYLYGTAKYGGTDNYGTIYRASVPGGVLSTFAEITGGNAGFYPQCDLIQASDGNFYGTTYSGGTSSSGTFFRVTQAGVYTVLYNFTGDTDGGSPYRGVVQGTDGAFYGTTATGGSYSAGAAYRLDVSGTTATLTVLHDFIPSIGEGSMPFGGLLQASDGNFYGTTYQGGGGEAGTIFAVTPTGGYTTVYSFANGTDGGFPIGGLTQASNGKLYGTTAGINGSSGTIFALDFGLKPPLPQAFYPLQSSAQAGDTILVKGNYFVGTTGVSFAAPSSATVASTSINVLSKTIVSAVVPATAVTGPITVTTVNGSSTTSTVLTIATPTPPPTPAPPPTPELIIVASDPVATRAGGNNGAFKIIRNGDTSPALTVPFKLKGTAVRGTDYNLVVDGETLATVTDSVTIPAGASKLKIKVVPVVSSVPGPDLTVALKLKAGTGYDVGSPKKAVVDIAGNTGGS